MSSSEKEERFRDLKPISLAKLAERPLVSVLIANYNYAEYLGDAVESVLEQTYGNFEVIICDDCSADNSLQVGQRYAESEPRVKLVRHAENRGQAAAWNNAFAVATGDLIAVLDADDVWFPKRLEKVIEMFRSHPDAGIVTHRLRRVTMDGKVLKDRHPRRLDQGWLAPLLLSGGTAILPPASGLTFRQDVAKLVFPLPDHFRAMADGAAAQRAGLLTPVAALEEVLGLYRYHGANIAGVVGPPTVQQVDSDVLWKGKLLEDRAEFARVVYGLHFDADQWDRQGRAHLLFARQIQTGDRVPLRKIYTDSHGLYRWAWLAVFGLPGPIGKSLFRWWWGEGIFKRWVRRLNLSPW